jgi:hypothetical protein
VKKKVSVEDVIIETMPFSDPLMSWCRKHPTFRAALKNVYADKFISLGAISITYPRSHPNSVVYGVFTYDYTRSKPLFKQDFIVNKEGLDREFILYTRDKKNLSKYVKDINEFYVKYGAGGDYKNTHHLKLDELPEGLRDRGLYVIGLANRIRMSGEVKRTSKKFRYKLLQQIRKHKKESKYSAFIQA